MDDVELTEIRLRMLQKICELPFHPPADYRPEMRIEDGPDGRAYIMEGATARKVDPDVTDQEIYEMLRQGTWERWSGIDKVLNILWRKDEPRPEHPVVVAINALHRATDAI